MLFAMGAYEGGCPCAASATDALWGGGCPRAHALLRYFSQQSTLAPNSFLTRFPIVPQQTGFSRVSPPNKFPHTLWVWGCWGLAYLHILLSIWVTKPGLVPAPGLGACVPGGVRACVAPFRGVFPALCACTSFPVLKLSLLSTHILVDIHLSFHLSLTYFLPYFPMQTQPFLAFPLLSFFHIFLPTVYCPSSFF